MISIIENVMPLCFIHENPANTVVLVKRSVLIVLCEWRLLCVWYARIEVDPVLSYDSDRGSLSCPWDCPDHGSQRHIPELPLQCACEGLEAFYSLAVYTLACSV